MIQWFGWPEQTFTINNNMGINECITTTMTRDSTTGEDFSKKPEYKKSNKNLRGTYEAPQIENYPQYHIKCKAGKCFLRGKYSTILRSINSKGWCSYIFYQFQSPFGGECFWHVTDTIWWGIMESSKHSGTLRLDIYGQVWGTTSGIGCLYVHTYGW